MFGSFDHGLAYLGAGYVAAMTENPTDDPSRPLTPAGIAEQLVYETSGEDVPVDEPGDPGDAEKREGSDPS